MKKVAIFPNMEAACIAQGMLSSNGIESEITSNALNTVFPAPDAYNGGITLLTSVNDAEEATRLLKEHGDI
ncbi:MAG: hypothetical protein J6C81_09260 [Muribaculaceae bacterium]|nr:hypothetical protein [Muribaculaceae bacterium]